MRDGNRFISGLTQSQRALLVSAEESADEVVRHHHHKTNIFGAGATPLGGVADLGAIDWEAYSINAGAIDGDFGPWTAIFASGEAAVDAGDLFYDPSMVMIKDVGVNQQTVLIEFAWGASGEAGRLAGDYTNDVMTPQKPTNGQSFPHSIECERIPITTPLWCRMGGENINQAADGAFLIYVKVHSYVR